MEVLSDFQARATRSKEKMILVLARSGQTCNQLMTIVAAYALGLRYNEDVKCPIVDDKLKDWFLFSSSVSPIKMEVYNTPWMYWLIRVLNGVLSRLCIRNLVFRNRYNPKRHGRIQMLFDRCWHKEDSAIIENLREVQRFFAFKSDIADRGERFVRDLRDGADGRKLVAVHARRGDYREFQGGRYYFTDEELGFWMRALASHDSVRFVFFSNEKINLSYYRNLGLDVVQSDGDAIDDLCRMSKCDYVMGPDSTYSWFAMMMGHIPRLMLEKGHGPYLLDDFKLYEDAPNLRG